MSAASANRRGIIALVIATGCFAANDAIVKTVARAAPLGEVLFVRGLMTSLLVGVVLVALGHFADLRHARHRLVLARSCGEALAALFFTSALIHMPLAELSAVVMISPLVITALCVVLFKETVGWRRWTAIGVGFAGTLFVIKPTPASFDAWALLGVACAFASAGRDILTRRLPNGIPSIVVSFMSALAVTIAGAFLGLSESWRPLTTSEVVLLAMGAVVLAGANFLVVLAFRGVEISAVAPFRYSILIWAGLAGYLVFGELPDRWALIGAAIIVGSGVYALHRERIRARELADAGAPRTSLTSD